MEFPKGLEDKPYWILHFPISSRVEDALNPDVKKTVFNENTLPTIWKTLFCNFLRLLRFECTVHSEAQVARNCIGVSMTAAAFKYLVQLHKDVPKAARFYSEGLGFTISVCTLRWAELHSGPLRLALLQSPREHVDQKGYSSLLSFNVTDINSTMSKLMALGAELDGPIKHEIHGKVASVRCIDGHVLGLYEPA